MSNDLYARIDVEALFGHVSDPDRRQKRAQDYAYKLAENFEDLPEDRTPVVPEEVTILRMGVDPDEWAALEDVADELRDLEEEFYEHDEAAAQAYGHAASLAEGKLTVKLTEDE